MSLDRRRRRSLSMSVAALVLAACGGETDDAATTATGAANETGSDSESGTGLAADERATICESFVEEHGALLGVPLHLRTSAYHGAAERLEQRPPTGDEAARVATEMAAAAAAIERLAASVAEAESALSYAPVNYMYTYNGLFVDDGDPTSLAGLDVPVTELQAAIDSSDVALATVERLCEVSITPTTDG